MKKIVAAYFILGALTGFTVAIGLEYHSLIGNGRSLQHWILPLCVVVVIGAGFVGRMSNLFGAERR